MSLSKKLLGPLTILSLATASQSFADGASPTSASGTKEAPANLDAIMKKITEMDTKIDEIQEEMGVGEKVKKQMSASKREGKRFDILGGVGYRSWSNKFNDDDTSINYKFFTGSYYQKSDLKFGLSIGLGSDSEDEKVAVRRYSLNTEYFLGNSIKAGLAYNSTSFTYDGKEGISTSGFEITFGNQWTWDNFTLAWDWASYEHVIGAEYRGQELDVEDAKWQSAGLTSLRFGWSW